MAGTNAIGQGAVILTANADKLLDGLGKAEKATEKFAKTTTAKANAAGKSAGGGGEGGGIFGALMFGGAAGAAAAVAMKGIDLVTSGAGKLVEKLSSVGEKVKEYGNIDVARRLRIDRAAKGFDRISAAADDFYFRIAEKLAPVIEKVATVLEVVSHVGARGFDLLVDSTGKAISLFGDLIGATDSFGDAGETATQRTFNGLRNVAKGLQKVHNLLGSVGEFGIDAVSASIEPYATQLLLLDKIAGTDFSGAAKAEYEKVLKQRGEFSKASTLDIDKEFDKLQKTFAATDRIKKSSGITLAGAYGSASNDAQSIISRFQAANIVTGQVAADNPVKIAKEQLKETKEQKKLLNKLVQRAERTVPLEILP